MNQKSFDNPYGGNCNRGNPSNGCNPYGEILIKSAAANISSSLTRHQLLSKSDLGTKQTVEKGFNRSGFRSPDLSQSKSSTLSTNMVPKRIDSVGKIETQSFKDLSVAFKNEITDFKKHNSGFKMNGPQLFSSQTSFDKFQSPPLINTSTTKTKTVTNKITSLNTATFNTQNSPEPVIRDIRSTGNVNDKSTARSFLSNRLSKSITQAQRFSSSAENLHAVLPNNSKECLSINAGKEGLKTFPQLNYSQKVVPLALFNQKSAFESKVPFLSYATKYDHNKLSNKSLVSLNCSDSPEVSNQNYDLKNIGERAVCNAQNVNETEYRLLENECANANSNFLKKEENENVLLDNCLADESAPEIIQDLSDLCVFDGDVIMLSTKVREDDTNVVVWKKDKEIIKESPVVKMASKDGIYSLNIRNATINHSGIYTCEIKNKFGMSQTSCKVLVERKPVPPMFKKKMQTRVSATEGDKVEFVVTVEAMPNADVKWALNNNEIVENQNVHLVFEEDTRFKLLFDSVSLADSGKIKCTAVNSAGTVSCISELVVKQGPPKVICKSDPELNVLTNNNLKLEIEIPGDKKDYKVEWSKGVKPIFRSTKKYEVGSSGEEHFLIILSVQESDQGIYKCIVTGPSGKTTKEFNVLVAAPEGKAPVVLERSEEEIVATTGAEVSIFVKILAYPEPKVTWLKDDLELPVTDSINLINNGDLHYLNFKSVDLKDDADYICSIENEYGSIEVIFSLIVKQQQQRPTFVKTLLNTKAQENEEVVFSVVVEGFPRPLVEWKLDEQAIEEGERFQLFNEDNGQHTFVICHCSISDAGIVSCCAKNIAGEDLCQADLSITKKEVEVLSVEPVSNQSMLVNERSELSLSAKVNNADKVIWYHNDKVLRKSNKVNFTQDGCVYKMQVLNISMNDAGKYVFEVFWLNQTQKISFDVEVEQAKKADVKPVISAKFNKNIKVNEADNLILEADVSGFPLPQVDWYFNGLPLKVSSNIKISVDKMSHILSICKFEEKNVGCYKLVANNKAGSSSVSADVTILATLPKFIHELQNINVVALDSVVFQVHVCHCDKVKWFLDDLEIEEDEDLEFKQEGDKFFFSIAHVNLEDAGIYECHAINKYGTSKSSCVLSVAEHKKKSLPVIRCDIPEILKIKAGETLLLDFNIENTDKFHVTFFKDESEIIETNQIKIHHQGSLHSLEICNVQKEDSGIYLMEVEFEGEFLDKEIEVQVEPAAKTNIQPSPAIKPKPKSSPSKQPDLPVLGESKIYSNDGSGKSNDGCKIKNNKIPMFTSKLKDVEAFEMSAVRLDVVAVGAELEFNWYKNNICIDDDDHFFIEEDDDSSTLIIREATVKDSGVYKCVVFNKEGEDKTSAELFVQGQGFDTSDDSESESESVTESDSDESLSENLSDAQILVPEIILPLCNQKALIGDTVIFSCRVAGLAEEHLPAKWYINSNLLKPNNRVKQSIENDSEVFSLTISNVSFSDCGVYKLVFSNPNQPIESSASLEVKDLPDTGVDFLINTKGSKNEKKPQPTVAAKPFKTPLHEDSQLSKGVIKMAPQPDIMVENIVAVEEEIVANTVEIAYEAPKGITESFNAEDEEIAQINSNDPNMKINLNDSGMKFLAIKEMHTGLNREVLRHQFEKSGIDVVVMPATPRDSPLSNAKPEVVKKPEDLELKVGDVAEFEVVLKDRGDNIVSWKKDGNLLFSSGRIKIWDKGKKFFLQVKNLIESDEGLYECHIRNEFGETMLDVALTIDSSDDDSDEDEDSEEVDDEIQLIKQLEKEYVINEGELLKLEVKTAYNGDLPLIASWYYDNMKLIANEDILLSSNGDVHTLLIPVTVFEDEGNYKCIVSNEVSSVESQTVVFIESTVQEDPKNVQLEKPPVIKQLRDCSKQVGEKVIIETEISNSNIVKWFINNEIVSESRRIQTLEKNGVYSLIINSLTQADEGEVKVTAINDAGLSESACELLVEEIEIVKNKNASHNLKFNKSENEDEEKEGIFYDKNRQVIENLAEDTEQVNKAPSFLAPLTSHQVTQGNFVRLDVEVTCIAPYKVKWLRGGVEINHKNFPNLTLLSDKDLHSVLIAEAQLIDTALFTCIASNTYGEASCSADLLVLPKIDSSNDDLLTSDQKNIAVNDEEEDLSMLSYAAIDDYNPLTDDFLSLKKDDIVEVLDSSHSDAWLVRNTTTLGDIGFVSPSILKKVQKAPSSECLSDDTQKTDTKEDSRVDDINKEAIQKDLIKYVAIANFEAKSPSELSLSEGMVVELLDGTPSREYWLVRAVNEDGTFGLEGLVPSTHLEVKGQYKTPILKDDSQDKQDSSRSHREKVLKEIYNTEKTYVDQLGSVLKNHVLKLEDTTADIPPILQGKSNTIFSNIADIHKLHFNTLLPQIAESITDHKSMASVFYNNSYELEKLYLEFCVSRPAADEILNKPESIEFWDTFQHDIEDAHSLRAYLITPVQRITRYQLLLKEVLKYTTRLGEDTTAVEGALSKISNIIQNVNDSMHVMKIIGYEGEIPLDECGAVLKRNDVLCWEGSKGRGKGKERHLFLCKRLLIGTKKTELHGEINYTFKFCMKASDVGQTENIEGFPTRWSIWSGNSASTASSHFTLEAKTEHEKVSWVTELRELLANQLTALKDSLRLNISLVPVSPLPPKSPKVLKRSKTESDMFSPWGLGEDQETPALTESMGLSSIQTRQRQTGDIMELEEAYLAAEYIEISTPSHPLVVGDHYVMRESTKTKGSCKTILQQGDTVVLLEKGMSLYLVELLDAADPSKRTWVPASYLLPVHAKKHGMPELLRELTPVQVLVGDRVTISCQFGGVIESIQWQYEELSIMSGEGMETIFEDDGTIMLNIKNARLEDEGNYSVSVGNKFGTIKISTFLTVGAPAKITESFKTVIASLGETVSLQLCFVARPSPQLKWYKNGLEVVDEGKYIIETSDTNSILDIADMAITDFGEYTCVVSNKWGSDTCKATVSLKPADKPKSPGIPKFEKVTDKSVSLSWSKSASTDVSYIIEKRNCDQSEWQIACDEVVGSSCVINDLIQGEEYFFRVLASKDGVRSDPSHSSEKVLIEAPRRKKNLKNAKRKSAKSDEDSDSEKDVFSPSESSKRSPTARKPLHESSSDEEVAQDKGKGKSISRGSRSPSNTLFAVRSKGRSRSRSPMHGRETSASEADTNEMSFGPPYFKKELENCFVVEGGTAQFKCRVKGNPEPEIQWYKDNEKIVSGKQFSISADGNFCTLVINQSNHDTAGSFTCVAFNSEGTVKSTGILFVEGLQTEYDSETEDEISDPEPQAKKQPVDLKKEDLESYYVLKEELGRGKFGVVNKCVDKFSNIEYAAKFIKYKPSERSHILNEIDIMNSLNHKRLINLVAAFEQPKQIVLVLELVTGGELFEKLTEEEYISEKDVTFYMKQVLQGVQHMHENDILHLDLKPENIMLVNPRSTQIKLIDFGLARRYQKGGTLRVLFGTPEFMAPEVINYDEVTKVTDTWSIGVITYVLLSGLSPFAGDDDSETLTNVTDGDWDFDDPVFEDISDEAKDFISELLVKDPKKRATVKDCLDHPWFMFKKFKKKIRTDRLKAFTARRKWKKTITAVRSTNFLTRLLTGIKTAQPDNKTDDKKSSTNAGPTWTKAENLEDDSLKAPIFAERMTDLKVKRGDIGILQASFVNDGTIPTVCWKKEGRVVLDSKRIHSSVLGNAIVFKIINCQLNDTGRYTLRLENQNGATECSAQLIVRDKPSAPEVPVVPQALATSALVQWQPPFDGNSPILSYNLQYRKLGDKEWSTFADEIKEIVAVIEDLEPNSLYKFRVGAANEIGRGEMSESTELIQTPPEKSSSGRSSINAPGARRVSRSSSIKVAPEIKRLLSKSEVALKEENPEQYYNFKEEIGRGKFAVVKVCASKTTGDTYAAKLVKYDEDTMEVTKKEYEIWRSLNHVNLVTLRDAYIVRKYLILICDLVNGVPVLDYLINLKVVNENIVANCITELLDALQYLHGQDICHLDIKPGNMMVVGSTLKLIDYGVSRKIVSKEGEVGEMVGTAEFMAPETINFEPVFNRTDIWSVGVVTYALLSGISPFATDDEDETKDAITALDYRFEPRAFSTITEEAKTFIKRVLIRAPEKRPSVQQCLQDPWLSDDLEDARLKSSIPVERLIDLSDMLNEQDYMENVRASLVLRTFLQSPYDSPESSSEVDSDSDDQS